MATRYWVGGSGTWNASSTTNWSATSGGAGGASAPVAADTVIFDSLSGTGTCTTAAGATCTAVTLNSSTLGLTLGAALTMTGTFNLTLGTLSLQSFALTCNIFTSANSNARTIAFGTGNVTVTGNNNTIFNTAITTNLSVTGTPVVNSTYSGGTGTRTIAVGANTGTVAEAIAISVNVTAGTDIATVYGVGLKDVNFTGFSGTWSGTGNKTLYGNLTMSPTMSFSAGNGTLLLAATSGTKTITSNGVTIDNIITIDGVGGTFQFTDALTQGSTRPFTITNGTVRFKAGTTNTVGSFTTGSGTAQRFLQSDTLGSRATITDPSGTNTATYLTIQDITATGGATWRAFLSSGNVDGGNNVGWDFNSLQIGRYMYNTRKSKRVLP